MNWYKTSQLTKVSKHMGPQTAFCKDCLADVVPIDVTYNPKHFFHFGQHFSCPCGEAQIWTNSVRNPKQLTAYIKGEDTSHIHPSGFCNDRFCPICWNSVGAIQNSYMLYSDNGRLRHVEYSPEKRSYFYDDTGEPLKITQDNVRNLSSYDLFGCRGRQHNQSIIMRGFDYEYGEGEYEPIFEWFKTHQNLFPSELVEQMKE